MCLGPLHVFPVAPCPCAQAQEVLLGEVEALRAQAVALRQELTAERAAHSKEHEALALEVHEGTAQWRACG